MGQHSLKSFIKAVAPPFLVSLYQRFKQDYGFFGDYSSWEEAVADSIGYGSDLILNKVRDSLLQVRDGKAAYERDSVLFDRIEYSFPVLAGLLKVALENKGRLSVLDFGGSLGSSYYQYKDFLSCLHTLEWSIVEQPNFVECGRQLFQNEQLKFYFTIEECVAEKKIDLILLSSVIQYLENPFEFLKEVIHYLFPYILIDITAIFSQDIPSRLTIQKVPPNIYEANYPAWIFNELQLCAPFQANYDCVYEFNSLCSNELKRLNAQLKGYFWRIKNG